jgi:RecB family exonuclease
MRALSASGIGRLRLCPASGALPSVNESSAAADRGTAIHDFVAKALIYGRDAALEGCTAEERKLYEPIDLDAIRALIPEGAEILCEVALEYNTDTGESRVLGHHIGRAYPARPGCVYGTIDLLARTPSHGVVLDFKTGLKVEAARDNWQLKTLAVPVARVFGVSRIQIGIVYLWGEQTIPDLATMTDFDLDAATTELERVVLAVDDARRIIADGLVPDVNPSETACKWCGCYAVCPAKTAMIKALPAQLRTAEETVDALTPEGKGAAWEWLDDAERSIKKLREILRDHARHEPFVTPSGATVQPVEESKRYVDGEKAYPILVAEFGDDVIGPAFARDTSATALKKIFKGAEHKRVMQLLEDNGAVKVSTTISVKAVK